MTGAPLLAVSGLRAGYGRIGVLDGVTFEVAIGACVGILGHNGMGKTTLLKAIMGLLPATAGTITWRGQPIGDLPAHQRARLGLGYVPQGRQIFPGLSVRDNLRFAALAKGRPPEVVDTVLADFPELQRLLDRAGGALSGGEQQLLALARTLCGEPSLILLDEPTEGVQPSIVQVLAARLSELRQQRGMSLLLVEQNLDFIQAQADRILLIQRGRVERELQGTAPDESEVISEFTVLP